LGHDILPLLIIGVTAFLAPVLGHRIRRWKIPVIVLEILFGILLGRSGLGLAQHTPIVDFLSEFGFIFLMFLSGFELDFSQPRSLGQNRVRRYLLPFGVFFLTVLCSLGSAEAAHRFGMIRDPILFALIFSTTSVGIVLPTLKERGEVSGPFGQTIVISALIADLSTIVLLSLYVVYLGKGLSFEILLILVLFGAFLILYAAGRYMRRTSPAGRLLEEMAHASTQIKVRGSLVLLVLFVALAEAIGVEAIISAFLAGALVSVLAGDGRATLSTKLDALGYGFFIPVFFIMVGAKLDLRELFLHREALLLVPFLIGIAFLVKLLPALLLTHTLGLRNAFAGGLLLSSRLALIIAASEIALKLGAITSTVNTAVVLTAIVTCLASPVLYARVRREVKVAKPRVVIVGAGRIGREIIAKLVGHGLDVVLVEKDPDQLYKLSAKPDEVVLGDCTQAATLAGLGLHPTDIFVALTGRDEDNLRSCLLAREAFGLSRLIARDNNPANGPRFTQAGVTPLQMSLSVAVALENLILRPTLTELMADKSGDLFAFEVCLAQAETHGKKVKDIRELGEALLILVKRGDSSFVPHGNTRLEKDDRILLLGSSDEEARLRSALC